jgi:hypothetical protein
MGKNPPEGAVNFRMGIYSGDGVKIAIARRPTSRWRT